MAGKTRNSKDSWTKLNSTIKHDQILQIDLDANRINLLRGKGNYTLEVRVPPRYNLENLRSSEEFKKSTYSINSRVKTIITFTGQIAEALEDFQAVLEEYE
jgi:hypothetical protein